MTGFETLGNRIQAIEQRLNSRTATHDELVDLRRTMDGLRQELDQNRRPDDTQNQPEWESHQASLTRVRTELERHIDEEATRQQVTTTPAPGSPATLDDAMKKQEGMIQKIFEGIGPAGLGFMRRLFTNLHVGFMVDIVDKWAIPIEIHAKMREKFPAATVINESKDGASVNKLKAEYQKKLRKDSAAPDTYTFEMFYTELMEKLAKQETDVRSKMTADRLATYKPNFTIASLVRVAESESGSTGNGRDVAPGSPEAANLFAQKPDIELAHIARIATAFKEAGVDITIPPPGVLPTNPQERRDWTLSRKNTLVSNMLTGLRRSNNNAFLYIRADGALMEREPYVNNRWYQVITRIGSALAEDDLVLTGFERKLRENPIELYAELKDLNIASIDGLGGYARPKLTAIKTNLTSNVNTARHLEGRRLINLPEPAPQVAAPAPAPAANQNAAAPAANLPNAPTAGNGAPPAGGTGGGTPRPA